MQSPGRRLARGRALLLALLVFVGSAQAMSVTHTVKGESLSRLRKRARESSQARSGGGSDPGAPPWAPGRLRRSGQGHSSRQDRWHIAEARGWLGGAPTACRE